MKTAGFGLIEVLTAMALALLLLVGTAQLIIFAMAAKRSGDLAAASVRIAADKLESFKALPFDAPELEPGGGAESLAGASVPDEFLVSWEIAGGDDGTKTVRVRAHPRGRPRSRASLTLILCRDLGFGP